MLPTVLAVSRAGATPGNDEGPAGFGALRVGDPGFEPGTSSLSEKRSNRLS